MNKMNPRIFVAIIVIVLIIIVTGASFYMVDKDEQAVITRFGRYMRTADPGLNFKIPLIEKNYNVPVKKVLKEEFGFQTISSGMKSEFYRGSEEMTEARMLSADLKIIQIEWIVQYKISDPVKYLFNVRNPIATFRDFSKVAMSQIAGDYLFDEIITIAKSEITYKMEELLKKMIEEVQLGLTISTIQLINVTPPKEVEAAYNEVLQSQQEKDKIVNEAKMEYNKKVIPVEGEAERMIAQSEGYEAERVKVAEGEANYFKSLYSEYVKAPDITKKRIYLETISSILPNLDKINIIDSSQKNVLPFLPLDKSNAGGN
ncbi:MAG: FtsH protease activity modulator HflK [Spirochaetes bacterium]|nr:FtsH protease activity modulator HflK [Spirochaetota bacterium]